MWNSLDQDQARHFVGPDLGPNCLQRSSAEDLFVGPTGVYLLDFFCTGIQFYLLLSPYLCFISLLYLDLYVFGDDALMLGVFHANQISICFDPHLN